MIDSEIAWTDDTCNVVEGCTQVDEDCRACYAMGIAARFAQPQVIARREDGAPMETAPGHYAGLARLSPGRRLPQWTGEVRLRPDVLDAMFWRLLRARSPRRQFLCSMGDIFHAEVPDAFLDEVFARIAILEDRCSMRLTDAARPGENTHPIYMLTKRPERAAEYTNPPGVEARIERAARVFIERTRRGEAEHHGGGGGWRTFEEERRTAKKLSQLTGFTMPAWPLRSVALITSAGTQAGADARVPHLLRCKAAIRGVSCEPMTGPVDWTAIRFHDGGRNWQINALTGIGFCTDNPALSWQALDPVGLDWGIFGGESGDLTGPEERRPRPCEEVWLGDGVAQFRRAEVPAFVKQLGNDLAKRLGREGKGGKLEDLPPHLRVRQFPQMGSAP